MTPKTKVFYLHTIGDVPAYFSDFDEQIVYADRRHPAIVVPSLRQIRREQQKTIANRRSWGMGDGAGKYDYVRVEIPDVR